MSALTLTQTINELAFEFYIEWLKRQMKKFTKKTPVSVPALVTPVVEQPILSLSFEGFQKLVNGAIAAPVSFVNDPIGFFAQGDNFSIELEDGAMRCYFGSEEMSFCDLIAKVSIQTIYPVIINGELVGYTK